MKQLCEVGLLQRHLFPRLLKLTAVWPGIAFEQVGRTLLAELELSDYDSERLAAIDALCDRLFDEPAPKASMPETKVGSLLRRIIHLQSVVQRQQKIPVFGAGQIISTLKGSNGQIRAQIALSFHHPDASKLALQWSCSVLSHLLQQTTHQGLADWLEAELNRILDELRKYGLPGINNYHFQYTAFKLGIPVQPLVNNRSYIFGQGRHSRWMESSVTDQTSCFGVNMAHNKAMTSNLLARQGIPVPEHKFVASGDEAVKAAEHLGYPVVVKPDDQEQGRGVAAGLQSPQSVRVAFAAARKFSSRIMVQRHHYGEDYRLIVCHDKIIKILHRRPGGVTGDGAHTIAKLLATEQQTPRFRQVLQQRGVHLMELDDEVRTFLEEQGLTGSSIPEADQFVPLRRKSNISSGGMQALLPVNCAHPDNVELAVRASQAIRIDICGVDMILPDIARSWHETGAVIIELNAKPQIGWSQGPEAYADILTMLVTGNGRIPLHLVICQSRKALPTLTVLTRHAAGIEPPLNGLATPDKVELNGSILLNKPKSGFHAARILIENAQADGVLCVMLAEEVLHYGLPADSFDRISFIASKLPEKAGAASWAQVIAMAKAQSETCFIGNDIDDLQPMPKPSRTVVYV